MANITAFLHASSCFDPPQGNPRRGRRQLEVKGCLGCHAIDGQGGKVGPDLARSNVVGSKVGQLTATWESRALHGERGIAAHHSPPTLTGQELSDITTYVARLGRGPRTP